MSNPETALALTTPKSPIGLTMDLRFVWQDVLREDTGRQIKDVYSRSADNWFPRDDELAILKEAAALVVATYIMRDLELDAGVLHHMAFAMEFEKPIFIQSSFKDVAPQNVGEFALEEAEIIEIGSNTKLINERLGEL